MRKTLTILCLILFFVIFCKASMVKAEELNTKPKIYGSAELDKKTIINYILKVNPYPRITCSVEELVNIYYEEAQLEGIRPDLAISQAILETGWFRYGEDVLSQQNNFCGLGTLGDGVKGAYFATPREGIRAHIQHLVAYTGVSEPKLPIVDPRYEIASTYAKLYGQCLTWESLNGRWAVPGKDYGENIINIFERLKMSSK